MRIGALRHFANPAPHILSIDLIIYLQYSAGLVNLNLTYAVRFQYESTTNRISKIFRQVITPSHISQSVYPEQLGFKI